ncbi:hypothetical protein ACMD2_08206 [Ananas comosus]|uniref:Uncharacterized protein n=1 Tax=Ananas comosus TaxID=4615 RepID=A0A199VIV9_ANACO|nr:hypothetical protein ACMD2_08206 [Ananas comosus]
MPCGHGRISGNVDKAADRRSRFMFNRSPAQNSNQYCSKECVAEFDSRSSEQRCIIFTFFAIDRDTCWKLAPFLPPLQGTNGRNHLTSGTPYDMDSLESLSPQPTIIFQVDLPNEQKINMVQNSNHVKSPLSDCNSFRGGISRQSHLRKKWEKNVKNSTSMSASSFLASDNSSSSICDNFNVVGPDYVVNSVLKGEKTSKRSPRKKGKKKGKQYRKGAQRKASSTGLETQCEEITDGVSAFDKASSPSSSLKDVSAEKVDSENNNEFVDCSTTLVSCTSYSDEMDESEPTTSSLGFSGERFKCNSLSTSETPEIILSTFNENYMDSHMKRKDSHNNSSSISLDSCNATATDPFLDGWNSDVSGNCSDDTETQLIAKKNECEHNSLDSGLVTESNNVEHSCHTTTVNLSRISSNELDNCYVPDMCEVTERTQCSSEACSSNGFHPVISGKRGRRSKKMASSVSSNGTNHFSSSSIHGRTGKDSGHSVWQKVQKLDNECSSKPRTANITSQSAIALKESKTRTRSDSSVRLKQNHSGKATHSCRVANEAVNSSEIQLKSVDRDQINNAKSKPSAASKQAAQQSRKGSSTDKSSTARASKNHHKEALVSMPPMNNVKHISSQLTLPSVTGSQQRLAKPCDNVDLDQFEAKHVVKNGKEMTTLGNICQDSNVHMHIETKSLYGNSEDIKCRFSDLFLTDIDRSQCMKSETESSPETCKSEYSVNSILQKWVPIGKKDSIVSDRGIDSKASTVDHLVHNNNPTSDNAQTVVSQSCTNFLSSKDTDLSSPDDKKSNNEVMSQTHLAEAFDGTHNQNGFLRSETELDKIIHAVNDAYKMQIDVEGIQRVTGTPIADFEKFIYSASPVVGHASCVKSCSTCTQEQLLGNSLCRHQIPDVSLRSIWQWYEEPGCYGLEVKACDYRNLKRLRNSHSEFSAYFVPYLSAVQLFGQSKTSSCLASLPIFSKLFPQSSMGKDACLFKSSSLKGDQLVSSGDGELIFEYFESEQPPWRRPLFEKIKELVSGVRPSKSQIFGDPEKLENLNLNALHPASWFSVAWYPVYRIPDGNFHAAFLTYHSFGSLVQQSGSENMVNGLKHLVSPVVGLQTYNDRGEWWFQPRDSNFKTVLPDDAPYSNLSEVIKERLKTLKQTASVMARAVIYKGNERSANQHPDYEFFLSRSR